MSLLLIIDGYNLLGILGKRKLAKSTYGAEIREALVRRLSLYSQRKGHYVTLVFDAWQEQTRLEHHEHRTGVQVVFTKRGERADQVIQRLARQYGRACAVVSSDLEIIQTAKAHGAFAMKSHEFQVKLEFLVMGAKKAFAAKPSTISSTQGMTKIEDDGPLGRPNKKGNPHKLPKAVRARKRQLRGF